MSEDEAADDETEYIPTTVDDVDVDIRPPQDGPHSFDPMAQPISSGTLGNETEVAVRNTRVRDNAEILVEFGNLDKDGKHGVFFDAQSLVKAAIDAIEQTDGVEMPDPPEEDDE